MDFHAINKWIEANNTSPQQVQAIPISFCHCQRKVGACMKSK